MSKIARSDKPSAGALGALLAVGTLLVGAGLAWRQSRAGEASLQERTQSRLRPRHVEPNAAQIHVGPEG
jgi:hypothetical protein